MVGGIGHKILKKNDGTRNSQFGCPVTCTSGWESEYDDIGNEIKRTNLGEGFEPGPDTNGIITAEFRYDEYGREVERLFLDEMGNDHNCIFGFSKYSVSYDADGEIEEVHFWDDTGNEVTDLNGKVEKVVLLMHDSNSYFPHLNRL